MKIFIIIIIAFLFSQLVPYVLQPLIFKAKKAINRRRLKPFDCSACLSFWSSLIPLVFVTNVIIALLISSLLYTFSVWFELLKLENEL